MQEASMKKTRSPRLGWLVLVAVVALLAAACGGNNGGADVKDQTGLVGSPVVRKALTSHQIDMYWEYTRTGWITHLKNTKPIPDERQQYEAVRDADAKNGITWLDPAPMNNTYAIATNEQNGQQLQVSKVSDYAAIANRSP